jgi:hypothetical protein
MSEDKLSTYTQQLLDTSVSLTKEIENLREAYVLVNERLRVISALADKTTTDALKEAVDVEELARLAVIASKVSFVAAEVVKDNTLVGATENTVKAATDAHELATKSKIASKERLTSGGMPYPGKS